jgi:hypothetical protein
MDRGRARIESLTRLRWPRLSVTQCRVHAVPSRVAIARPAHWSPVTPLISPIGQIHHHRCHSHVDPRSVTSVGSITSTTFASTTLLNLSSDPPAVGRARDGKSSTLQLPPHPLLSSDHTLRLQRHPRTIATYTLIPLLPLPTPVPPPHIIERVHALIPPRPIHVAH